MSTPCSSGLAIDLCDDAGRVVVGAQGEIDASTSPMWRTVLSALVDAGHTDIVVDLEHVTFMGAAGIAVIAEVGGMLRSRKGAMTVRAAPPSTRRLLEITRVDELVQFELRTTDTDVRESADLPPAAIGIDSADTVHDLVRVGSMVTATTVVDRALQLVTVLAKAAIDGADGVSVSLERNDRLSTVAWSNDTVLQMDLHQYDTGEGPCVAAATTGRWYHINSLSEEARWPAFVPRALEEGIASILSTPLTTPAKSVGALNVYSNTEGAFGEAQLSLAGLFAEQASEIVVASLTDHKSGVRLAEALLDRELIAQAQGVVMAREHLTATGATAQLFTAARETDRTVSQQAAIVVASTQRGAST